MLFWKSKPSLNKSYSKILRKYNPNDNYFAILEDIKNRNLIRPTFLILDKVIELTNIYTTYILNNEQDFVKASDKFVYRSTLNYFVLLHEVIMKKSEKGKMIYDTYKDFFHMTLYYYIDDFIDELNYFSSNREKHAYRITFEAFSEAHYYTRILYPAFLNEMASFNKDEIIEALYVSLIERPSFSQSNSMINLYFENKRSLILRWFKSPQLDELNLSQRKIKVSQFNKLFSKHEQLCDEFLKLF